MEFDSEIECRYRELLQPIRELAANWDVDIADSLTDYLFELEKVRITLNGSASSVNFAEAALLIQGSTAIYSKKVEYLHSLVLQSLEMISRQNSTTRKDKKGEKAGDAVEAADGKTLKASQKSKVPSWEEDDRFLFGADMDPAFLLLDDYIEQAENIDLVKKPSKVRGVVDFACCIDVFFSDQKHSLYHDRRAYHILTLPAPRKCWSDQSCPMTMEPGISG